MRCSAGIGVRWAACSRNACAACGADYDRVRVKDKSDRATSEQVLDPKTRLIVSKYICNGVLTHMYGCISTGKEANVYYATSQQHGDCAVKIYKTSILV